MEIPIKKCVRCGHQWKIRVEDPDRCPKCRSYNYSEPMKPRSYINVGRKPQQPKHEIKPTKWERHSIDI